MQTLGAMLQHMLPAVYATFFVLPRGVLQPRWPVLPLFPHPCMHEVYCFSRSSKHRHACVADSADSPFQLLCSAWLDVVLACGPEGCVSALQILKDVLTVSGRRPLLPFRDCLQATSQSVLSSALALPWA